MKFILKTIINLLLVSILILLIILSTSLLSIFSLAKEDLKELKIGYTSTKIYSDDDTLIYTTNENYNYVSINQISKNLINAFISIEDESFYYHKGFNEKRIISAIVNNIKNNQKTGASTITQQYIKNAYLNNDKTFKRKLNELGYAIILERMYTKDQILEAYLNTILFGSNIYGISSACLTFFNKYPNEIDINEACFLAAIINAPNYYINNLSSANERKNLVLKKMLNNNYITQTEYNNNLKKDIILNYENKCHDSIFNSYLDYLIPKIDSKASEVKTYLDISIQEELNKIMDNTYKLFNDDNLNCSIVVLDNNTYGIKAIKGSRNNSRMVLNYATDILLQPGSTIKPILDYAPAIEYNNYTLASIIKDEPYTYKDGTNVKNYDNNYLGEITIRKALSDSRNIPAIKLFNEVGYDKAFSFANKLGIYSSEYYESDAIGGSKSGYTILDLANAYQAFANLGYYKKASAIKEEIILNTAYTNNEYPKLVMKPTTAFLINTVLHDVFKNSSFNISKSYLMAKTGQTNFDMKTLLKYNIPNDATKDSLIIAYTRDLTIGIWVGYTKVGNGLYLDRYKKNIPRTIMKILFEKFAGENLYYPLIEGIKELEIEIIDSKAYLSNNGYKEYFVTGTEPLNYYRNDSLDIL